MPSFKVIEHHVFLDIFSVMDGGSLNDQAREQVQELLDNLAEDTKGQELQSVSKVYRTYKDAFARNLMFDPTLQNLSMK